LPHPARVAGTKSRMALDAKPNIQWKSYTTH
jgi:hypothetical protein